MNQLGGTPKVTGQRWLFAVLMTASALLFGACSSGQEPYTESRAVAEAEETLLAAGHDEGVVRCAINVARPRLKRAQLSELALDELAHSCDEASRAPAGLANTANRSEGEATSGPSDFGDDPKLDALWTQCEAGDGHACDDLFDESATGSAYEQFGVSCGERPETLNCSDLNEPDEALAD